MTNQSDEDLAEQTEIDINVAHAARVYDYLLGGDNNFAVDREVAEQAAAVQGGIEVVRAGIRMSRDFLGRAVRYLAGEEGIRQFLDIGTGIPSKDNVHAVAQDTASDARIVYVDNDPVVLAHAHQLLRGTPEGSTAYLRADFRDPETILEQAANTLDFTKPVALMLVNILHFFSEDEGPYTIVSQLLQAMPSGSYLVVAHLTDDIRREETSAMAKRYNEQTQQQFVLRNKADIVRFFEGLEMMEPGIVPVPRWYPHEDVPPPPDAWELPAYAAVGRKA